MLKLLVGLSVVGVVFGSYRSPQLDGRIVGGNGTDITKHPYQLALLSNSDYFCGGVIVSYTWGLTAAHCFDYGIPFNLRVRGGSTNKNEGGQVIYVDEVLRHPNYHPDTLDYDAALMRFSEPFAIFATAPATMPELNHQLLEGEIGVVTGWGALQDGGASVDVLQEVEVPLVSLTRCRAIYGTSAITDRMFCAGYLGVGGKDACEGDSGGPLIINDILIGLVSWGTGCGDAAYPGVYTRVPAFSNWVLEIIER